MQHEYHVIVVGSGLAGLAAADIISRHGMQVLIIDDNAHMGGQLIRKAPHGRYGGKRFEFDSLKRKGLRLMAPFQTGRARVLNGARVLGIYPGHILLVEDNTGRVGEYRAEAIVLATGARERHLPFKGWTLPGVMSTGAAQILMKSFGILPGRKTLIGGRSPLMLTLATEILDNRGKVLAVLDQSSAATKLKAFTKEPVIGSKILEGIACLVRLAYARVPIKQSVRIVEASGYRKIKSVIIARVDSNDRIIQGTEQISYPDTLAVGHGFSPNIELPQQAGCAVQFNELKGGWFVDVDENMMSTVPDIYAAGETTGIAGGGKSFVEGQIAAWAILRKRGNLNQETYENKTRRLMHQRRRHVRYGYFLNRICAPQLSSYADIPDETVICRCEEITMGEIRKQLKNDFSTMNAIKKTTRCGMGNCQGRICGPVLFDILSAHTHRSPKAIGYSSSRAPIKMVSLGGLAKMEPGVFENNGDHSKN